MAALAGLALAGLTALRILLAGLVPALVRIRAVVAGFVLSLLVLLRGLLANLVLLIVFGGLRAGFALIVVGIISHDGSLSMR
jgi:hypothetical protein